MIISSDSCLSVMCSGLVFERTVANTLRNLRVPCSFSIPPVIGCWYCLLCWPELKQIFVRLNWSPPEFCANNIKMWEKPLYFQAIENYFSCAGFFKAHFLLSRHQHWINRCRKFKKKYYSFKWYCIILWFYRALTFTVDFVWERNVLVLVLVLVLPWLYLSVSSLSIYF